MKTWGWTNRWRRARKRAGRSAHSERAQVLVLFVVVFSIVLIFGAVTIDQGLWSTHRRIAQKDADAAARAGAAQYLNDLANPASQYSSASDAALKIAAANGAGTTVGTAPVFAPGCDQSTATTCARASCPVADGPTIAGAPSIEIAVPRPAPGLFIRALGGGDANDIGAKSTACLGSVKSVQLGDNGGLPLAIYSDDVTANSCFDHSVNPPVVVIGKQCTLKNGAQGNQSRGYFRPPPDGLCYDNGAPPKLSDIVNGVNFTCTVNTSSGNTCDSTDTNCINSFNGTVGQNVPTDFVGRLTRTANNNCPTGSTNPGSSAFADTFDYAGGQPGPVLGPPGLNAPPKVNVKTAAVDAFGTVYEHKACQTPRTALIIISDGGEQAVRGYAAIYIVGCFLDTDPLTNAINACDPASYDSSKLGHVELRGVIVNVFLTDEAVGDIGKITTYAPLAIQTTR